MHELHCALKVFFHHKEILDQVLLGQVLVEPLVALLEHARQKSYILDHKLVSSILVPGILISEHSDSILIHDLEHSVHDLFQALLTLNLLE